MMASLFPYTFVDIIVATLTDKMPDHSVEGRSLGVSEGRDSIGVFPASWVPDMDAKEIGSIEPTLSRYVIRIQNLRIDADEIEGRRQFSASCRKIRAILYRDTALRVALGGLTEDILGSIERVKMYDVTKQDYLSSKNQYGEMMYLCTTEMVFVTETTKVG